MHYSRKHTCGGFCSKLSYCSKQKIHVKMKSLNTSWMKCMIKLEHLVWVDLMLQCGTKLISSSNKMIKAHLGWGIRTKQDHSCLTPTTINYGMLNGSAFLTLYFDCSSSWVCSIHHISQWRHDGCDGDHTAVVTSIRCSQYTTPPYISFHIKAM